MGELIETAAQIVGEIIEPIIDDIVFNLGATVGHWVVRPWRAIRNRAYVWLGGDRGED